LPGGPSVLKKRIFMGYQLSPGLLPEYYLPGSIRDKEKNNRKSTDSGH
jgi:hypothetical protein